MKIVVIGAGVAGLSVAWRLAQAGCRVTVLERARPGGGASWAAGGMLAAGAEAGMLTDAEQRFAAWATTLWPDFASEIASVTGREVGYRRGGSLMAALDEQELGRLSARASGDARVLSSAEARVLEPMLTDIVRGALFDPDDGWVDNRALCVALAVAVLAAGVDLKVNEAVVRIECAAGRAVRARTPYAAYEADLFVNASGAWSGSIQGIPPDAVARVEPVKGEMIALKCPTGASVPNRLVWGRNIYAIPRNDSLWVGATSSHDGFDTTLTAGARDGLYEAACAVMPGLSEWQIMDHWAGLRPGTADGLPLIGSTTLEAYFLATGQFRNGILYAPAMAEAMKALVVDDRMMPEIAEFSPRRTPSRHPKATP